MEIKPKVLSLEKELEGRVRWLIRLRWLAVLCIFTFSWIPDKVLGIPLPLFQISCVGLGVLVLNIFYFFLKGPILTKEWFRQLQVTGDWLGLIFVVHYTGGIESPALFFFIFHVIIGALILSRRACFFEATLALIMITVLALLEATRIIPHMPIKEFFPWYLYRNPRYILGELFFLATTLYVAAYLATYLTQRLKQREAELAVAYERLKELDRAKDEYVLRVTHALKSPLSAINGLLMDVEAGYAGVVVPPGISDILGRIKRRTAFLMQLVSDLLDLAAGKLERPKKEQYKEINMKEAIKNTISLMRSKIEAKKLRLTVDSEPVTFLAVPSEIDHILTNLIDNAIKYTPEGGIVTITNRLVGKLLMLEVRDTGMGIPEEAKPRIFEEFFRAENARTLEKEGTGLGLAIVKNLVKHYEGEITFHSELNKGTVFTIKFPVKSDSR
ncbi:MAG TPA: sensor histidine kinase [Candidatus Hypogeohydataceae bacterium YC41]